MHLKAVPYFQLWELGAELPSFWSSLSRFPLVAGRVLWIGLLLLYPANFLAYSSKRLTHYSWVIRRLPFMSQIRRLCCFGFLPVVSLFELDCWRSLSIMILPTSGYVLTSDCLSLFLHVCRKSTPFFSTSLRLLHLLLFSLIFLLFIVLFLLSSMISFIFIFFAWIFIPPAATKMSRFICLLDLTGMFVG